MTKTTKRAKNAAQASVAGVSPLILANCAQLSHMAQKDVTRLAKTASCRLVREGETLFRQGDAAAAVYVLLDGKIDLERTNDEGIRTTGDCAAAYATFGDVVLLGEETRRYTATASRDTMVVELPLEPVLKAIEKNQPQGVAWRGSIMARLHRQEPQDADTFAWRILDRLSQLTSAA